MEVLLTPTTHTANSRIQKNNLLNRRGGLGVFNQNCVDDKKGLASTLFDFEVLLPRESPLTVKEDVRDCENAAKGENVFWMRVVALFQVFGYGIAFEARYESLQLSLWLGTRSLISFLDLMVTFFGL